MWALKLRFLFTTSTSYKYDRDAWQPASTDTDKLSVTKREFLTVLDAKNWTSLGLSDHVIFCR